MYDEDRDLPAKSNTSDINEELGLVRFILISDLILILIEHRFISGNSSLHRQDWNADSERDGIQEILQGRGNIGQGSPVL